MATTERKIPGTFSPVPGGYSQQIGANTALFIHGNLPGLTVDLPANHDNFFHAQHRPVPLSYLFILGVTLRPGVPFRHSARRIITVVCRHPALLTRVSTRFRV